MTQGLDIFNGAVKIDKTGQIEAESIKVAGIKVKAGTISGQAKIDSGKKTIIVKNAIVSQNSRILITPTSSTELVLAVTEKKANESFTVSTPKVLDQPVEFDWFIIQEY